jgi:hypothetical protein
MCYPACPPAQLPEFPRLPLNVIEKIVDIMPPHAFAETRLVNHTFHERAKQNWATIEGVRAILYCMGQLKDKMSEEDVNTPPVDWYGSSGRKCDDKLRKMFTYNSEVVPFYQLTGPLLFALQKCLAVDSSNNVTGVSFCPDSIIASSSDVDQFFGECFEDGCPPKDYPEDARALWTALRWVLHDLVGKFTFSKFYLERSGSDGALDWQMRCWLWEPKM